MAGNCVMKLPHSCGSHDALQVFSDGGDLSGYCFAGDTYVPDPLGKGKKLKDIPEAKVLSRSKEDILAEMKEISELDCISIVDRRLRQDALEHFGVKIGLSEQDGKTPRFVYFPYTKNGAVVKYKVRLLAEKRMWSVGVDNETDLFGWEQAVASGAKKLIITEGEYDAVAMYKILDLYTKTNFRDYIPAVVSVPNGAGNAAKDINKVVRKINRHFQEIILCFDNDEAGKKAVEETLKVLPRAKVVSLPCKDANEALMSNMGKAVWKAVSFMADKPVTTRLVHGSDLREAAMVRPQMGLSWPWEGLTKLTRGIRRAETYYFGAGVKMGKSEVVNELGKHLIVTHNLPVLFCKPEEDKARTYQNLVSKAAGRIFHDPNVEFDEEAFLESEKLIGDKAIIVDNYQFIDWDNLKDDIRYAVNNEGVHDIIIDPVTCFTAGMSSSDTNEFLIGWAAELAAMAKELQFTSYIFCHLKAPTNGAPHERGGEVLSSQFTGSRAMMRSCHMMIGIEGNKDPELPDEERNIRKLKILEDRNLGASGVVKLFWDKHTGLFNEMAY